MGLFGGHTEVSISEGMATGPGVAAMAVASLAVFVIGGCAAGPLQPARSASVESVVYDVVIRNGRVMDPESSLDAVGSVGVSDGVIRTIGAEPLTGRTVIDATGLIVAPGFIDVVWEIPRAYSQVQLLDGVTTALSLWIAPTMWTGARPLQEGVLAGRSVRAGTDG